MACYARASRTEVPVWGIDERLHFAPGHNEYKEFQDKAFQISSDTDKYNRVVAFSKNFMVAVDEDGKELPVDAEGNPKWPDLPEAKLVAKLVVPEGETAAKAVFAEIPSAPPKRRGRKPKQAMQENPVA